MFANFANFANIMLDETKNKHSTHKGSKLKIKITTNPKSTFITFASFEDFQKFVIRAVVKDIENDGPIRTAIIRYIR